MHKCHHILGRFVYLFAIFYKAYKLRVVPALTLNHVIKRLRFCYWWRKNAKSFKGKRIMFSDEKKSMGA